MNKKFVAMLCLMLALLICLAMVFSACKPDTPEEPEEPTNSTSESEKKGDLHYTVDDVPGVSNDWNEPVGDDTLRY